MASQKKEQRPPGKVAVIYARYSSAAQRDVSIEQQVNECRRFAQREGLSVLRIYDDHAMTGTNDNRPAFRQMIADSANGTFEYVIVYTLDRFARNQYDSVFNKKILRDNGVRVLSAMENLRDDPTGHLMESVLEGFAQYFSEELRQKVVRGMRSNAEKAMVIGPCPYGLTKGQDGKYAIVEEEAKILREIYRRAADGEPFADIFRDLNERGVKTKKSRSWDRSSFNQLLHNPKYVGIYSYGDIIIEGGIPPILDREIFDKVQLRCKAKEYPRHNPQRRRRENGTYLLTGKLYCGECKAAMIGASAHGHGGWYFYYTCKTHMDHKDQCRKKSVKRDEIELQIAAQLQQVFQDPDVVNGWIEDALAYKNRDIQMDEISLLQDQLKARTQEKENTLKAIRMGVCTDSVLAMLKEIEADESSLRARLSLAEERKATAVNPEELKALIRMLTDGDVNDKSFQERLFDSFLVKAYVYDDRLVLVVNPTVNGTDTITIPFDIDTVAETGKPLDSFEVLPVGEGSYRLPKGVQAGEPRKCGFPVFFSSLSVFSREVFFMGVPDGSCYAVAAFGLEGLVADELKRFGMADVRAENGGVRFTADEAGLFRCNLHSRFSDRMLMILAEGEAATFEDLFQLVSHVPWERYADGTEAFNISAKCVRSRLMSPRDCQAVSKKALIERLKSRTSRSRFPENGPALPIQISLRGDHAMILLNSSGASLSRRGYRTWNGEAPLRETLAAALVALSPWHPGLPLHDPCCGTGTIPIEAALMQAGRAPGRNRSFAMESFCFCHPDQLRTIRESCAKEEQEKKDASISGSDIDPEPLKLAERHLRQADLSGAVSFACQPLQTLKLSGERGVFVCNPPYGERMENQAECRQLYRDLGQLKARHPGWSLCAITSDPAFERFYGKRADKKRRLYNGRLECTYYIYR